ncbi:hypothetical protein ACTXGQ_16870 [Marinobacter sp. 1Y8]
MNTMKKWLLCFAISALMSCLGLAWFIRSSAQEGCLDSGGRWLGLIQGCEGGSGYSLQYVASPLAIAIFLGIVLGISSALVQVHSLIFSPLGSKQKSRRIKL